MEEEKKAFVKTLLQEGATRLAVKSACIGQGYGTAGIDDIYSGVLSELGISEPKDVTTALQATGERTLSSEPTHSQIKKKRSQFLVFCALVLVCGGVVFFGMKELIPLLIPEAPSEEPIVWGEKDAIKTNTDTLGFSDGVLETKVVSTLASADVQAGRMGSLDGVCKDISVVPPVQCTQSATSLAVFAPLSTGSFYCTDKAGFSGTVPNPPTIAGKCK